MDFVKEVLDGCGFSSETGIVDLVDKGLLTISDSKLLMFDALHNMGKEIVRQESIELGKQSRLWDHDDVHQVLTTNTGTGTIEGIYLDLSKSKDMHLSSKAFTKMCNLRILKICNHHGETASKVNLPDGLEGFPNELRLLCWHGFSLKTLPPKFLPTNLVKLNMPYSQLERLWEGTKMPDLSQAPKLERIVLQGCPSLARVHSSIQHLKKVTILNLKGCVSLTDLPCLVDSECLEILDPVGCTNLKELRHSPKSLKLPRI